jgi:hypothetical protein
VNPGRHSVYARRSTHKRKRPSRGGEGLNLETALPGAVRNSRCNVGIFISEGDRKVAGSMLAAECLPNFSDHF